MNKPQLNKKSTRLQPSPGLHRAGDLVALLLKKYNLQENPIVSTGKSTEETIGEVTRSAANNVRASEIEKRVFSLTDRQIARVPIGTGESQQNTFSWYAASNP